MEHIPDWHKEWEKEKSQEQPFSHLGQDNEASISLPPKSSTDEACEEPLAVDDLFAGREVNADDN